MVQKEVLEGEEQSMNIEERRDFFYTLGKSITAGFLSLTEPFQKLVKHNRIFWASKDWKDNPEICRAVGYATPLKPIVELSSIPHFKTTLYCKFTKDKTQTFSINTNQIFDHDLTNESSGV